MKNLRFISGLCLGVLLGVLLSILITCKSESPAPVEQIQNSSSLVKGLDMFPGDVYKLTIDNIQYLVVRNGNSGDIAIIKHK
jgi:hypothetical protein